MSPVPLTLGLSRPVRRPSPKRLPRSPERATMSTLCSIGRVVSPRGSLLSPVQTPIRVQQVGPDGSLLPEQKLLLVRHSRASVSSVVSIVLSFLNTS